MLDVSLPTPDVSREAGIVYVGGGRFWPMLRVGLRMARRVTPLPIRVYHREPPGGCAGRRSCRPGRRDLHRPDDPAPLRMGGGWQCKSVAIADAPFRRVLYLDADAYLVSDPAGAGFAGSWDGAPLSGWATCNGRKRM